MLLTLLWPHNIREQARPPDKFKPLRCRRKLLDRYIRIPYQSGRPSRRQNPSPTLSQTLYCTKTRNPVLLHNVMNKITMIVQFIR